MKKLFTFAFCAVLTLGSLVSPADAYAAKAGERDSHGNIVPAGREEIDNSAPHPLGWGNAPQTTAEAMKLGWSKRIPMKLGSGRAYFWVRETEVVPKGEKPWPTVHSRKMNTNVPGNELGKEYAEVGTTVDVYSHRYIYADDDFTPPTKEHNPGNGDMMAPHRGLPPYSALPVPAYSFHDEELQKKYFSTLKKAEIGTFWGSSAVADKREGQVFYCINPNAVDPVQNTAYFAINTKYDYQSNYRNLPELNYLLGTLMYNGDFYNQDGSPNWDRGFDNLLKEFNRIVGNMDDLNSSETGALDKRITLGELRNAMNTLMGKNGPVKFSGETMRVQNDPEPESGLKPLDGKVSNSGAERKNDILVLGFEYPVGHYMQGMPIAEADKWFGRNGMWDYGDQGYQKARTIYGRAFARMLVAYTELARQKDLLGENKSPYTDIELNKVSQTKEAGKTVAKFAIKDVAANGISGYTVIVPQDLADKITITDPEDMLSTPASGKYMFHPDQLKNGFTVKVDPSVSVEDVKKVKISRHFKDTTVATAYSSKENYRYDEETKRWYIREMIVADVEGFTSTDPQRKHGMGYGQEIIQFSRSANERTASIALDLTLNAYDLKTTVGADTFAANGKKEFKYATEKAALESTYTAEQLKAGIQVKDTVAYKGLEKDKKYKLVAVLNELTDENQGTVTPIAAKVGAAFTPDSSVSATDFVEKAKTEVDFGTLKNLEGGKKYVVYEYLFDADTQLTTKDGDKGINDADKGKALRAHENALDKGQTFKPTEKLTLKTTAYLGTDSAPEGTVLKKDVTKQELTDGIEVSDRIAYTGLNKDTEYKFVAVLNEVDAQGKVTPVKATVSQSIRPNDRKMALVRFGKLTNLKPNTNYVIYEYLFKASDKLSTTSDSTNITDEDKSKALASHADKNDKSQTFVLVGEPEGSLKTTVSVDGKKASVAAPVEVDPAESVTVVDKIDYTGLVANKEYTFAGRLMEVSSDGSAPKEVASASVKKMVDAADGSVEVTFENVKLEAGKTYVVFETATSIEKLVEKNTKPHVVKHEDPKDKSQTVKVRDMPTEEELKGSLRTTVSVDGKKASVEAPVEVDPAVKATVVDTIDYKGLVAGQEYTFAGRLMEVPSDGSAPKEIAKAETKQTVKAADGSVEVTFENVKLEAGKTYVVFETATSTENLSEGGKKPHVVKHEDPKDKSQTVKVKETPVPEPKGSLKTTVSVDGKKASVVAPVEVDPAVKATVVDTIDYKGLVKDKEYTFAGRLMEIPATGEPKEVASASVKKTVDAADGSVEVTFKDVKLEAGRTYVVFETATSTENLSEGGKKPHVVKHEDPSDKSQTVKVKESPEPTPEEPKGELRTTVSVNGMAASEKAPVEVDPADKATVKDKIDYKGLVANKEYTFSGRLMEIPATGEPKEVASASVKKTVDAADGSVEVTFENVKLEAGKTYVVFETATSTENLSEGGKKPHVVKHEDPTDKSQTVKVKQTPPPSPEEPKGELRTTVSVNGMAASEKAPVEVDPADKATVKDKIDYAGLVAGKEYTFSGRLMEIPATGEPKEVAKAESKQVVKAADGSVEVTFKDVKLEAGKTYVVFETATSTENLSEGGKKPHVVKHEDPSDKSQTVKVKETPVPEPKGSLRTTVSVNGMAASEKAPVEVDPADKATVKDKIDYTGLVANKEYTFSGRLMEIPATGEPKEVASASVKKMVDAADGSVEVTFENVKLEAGKTYVVFETATSTENLSEGGKKPHVVKHEDPTDKSQTVKVKQTPPAPPTPPVPNIPGKPGEPGPKPPAPHVPGKPALTDTGVSSTGSLAGALGCLVSGALVLLYRRRRFE